MEEKRMRKAFAEKLAFELRFEGSVDIMLQKVMNHMLINYKEYFKEYLMGMYGCTKVNYLEMEIMGMEGQI